MLRSPLTYVRRQFNQVGLYFFLALAVAVAGFWPSFFAVLGTTTPALMIHGFSATIWMFLPIAQFYLVRTGRRQQHRVIGYCSLLLAAIVVISGLHVLQLHALKNLENFDVVRFKFVWLDLTGLALFTGALGLAILSARGRDFGLHVRLLACTALIPLEAAIERLFINLLPDLVPDFDTALFVTLFVMETICLTIILAEWIRDRIRWPVPTLLCYYVFMHLTVDPVATNPAFQSFSMWFATIGNAAPSL